MDNLGTFLIDFDNVDFLKVFNSYLDVSRGDLKINNDFLVLRTSKSITILFIWL